MFYWFQPIFTKTKPKHVSLLPLMVEYHFQGGAWGSLSTNTVGSRQWLRYSLRGRLREEGGGKESRQWQSVVGSTYGKRSAPGLRDKRGKRDKEFASGYLFLSLSRVSKPIADSMCFVVSPCLCGSRKKRDRTSGPFSIHFNCLSIHPVITPSARGPSARTRCRVLT